MSSRKTLPKAQYTIGWVCALHIEFTAAQVMLDERHEDLEAQDPSDHNSYVLGRIHKHNIAIACLPSGVYGTTSAATVAKDMLRTFKSIKIGLMVGIGGGIPSEAKDLRLGDIIVSQPTSTNGGVTQHDRGKIVTGGRFEQTGQLNSPPTPLLTALSKLRANHEAGLSHVSAFLRNFEHNPMLKAKGYVYPGAEHDHLYESVPTDLPSAASSRERIRRRLPRASSQPKVFYGIMASGNQVIKDRATRDRLGKRHNALCFEMEAAGLLNHFPCLVIRGICDYSDEHKNDNWQRYAAATAASFAKELLLFTASEQVFQTKPIKHVSDSVFRETTKQIQSDMRAQNQIHDMRYKREMHRQCHQVFKTSAYEVAKNINKDRIEGTCMWVIDAPEYKSWQRSTTGDLLCVSADPGCGKSVLSKWLIDDKLKRSGTRTICYFFFKDNEGQNTLSQALCALLHQLFNQKPGLLEHATTASEANGDKLQTEMDEMWRILIKAAADPSAGDVVCVLDALDECRGTDRVRLADLLNRFYTGSPGRVEDTRRRSRLWFLITSRPYFDVTFAFDHPPAIRLRGENENKKINAEINLVIKAQVRELRLDKQAQSALENKLSSMSNRTYLWLYLVMEEVRNTLPCTSKEIDDVIDCIPQTIEDAYERLLRKSTNKQAARTLLHMILGARCILSLKELKVAFYVTTSSSVSSYKELSLGQNHHEDEISNERFKEKIRNLCGLFVFVHDGHVYLIHQTAKEFLLAKNGDASLGNHWKHSLHEAESELIMAKACIRYLLLKDFDDLHRLADPDRGRWPSEDSVEYGFFEYSQDSWADHVREARADQDSCIVEWVLKLYESQSWFIRESGQRYWMSVSPERSSGRDPQSSPLYLAIRNRHWAAAKRMISTGHFDIKMVYSDRSTPLHWAASRGGTEGLKLLLETGKINVNSADRDGKVPLHVAVESGVDSAVELLLKTDNIHVNTQNSCGWTPLHMAVSCGRPPILKLLLDIPKVNVRLRDAQHHTALHLAARRGSVAMTKLLLNRSKIDLSSKDIDGRTPREMAVMAWDAKPGSGHSEVVDLLDSVAAVQRKSLWNRRASVQVSRGVRNTPQSSPRSECTGDPQRLIGVSESPLRRPERTAGSVQSRQRPQRVLCCVKPSPDSVIH